MLFTLDFSPSGKGVVTGCDGFEVNFMFSRERDLIREKHGIAEKLSVER